MHQITPLLICLAFGGNGHRVKIATDQAAGDSGSLASLHSRTSLNQSSGVPLKTFLKALLAAGAFASSNAVPSNAPLWSAPPNAASSMAESPSGNQFWRRFAKPHLRWPFFAGAGGALVNFAHNFSEPAHRDNSGIGKLPLHSTVAARRKGTIIPRIKQMSSLSARSKHIYDLRSGEILLLSKRDGDAESMQTENNMLQMIQQAGIPVVPHKLIKTINPRTGNIVKGMVQTRVPGTFVRFRNVEILWVLISREKLASFLEKQNSLTLNPTAFRNLREDLLTITRAGKSGFRIRDLQGIIQPDGHFILIDPLGVTLPGGKYVGNSGRTWFGR